MADTLLWCLNFAKELLCLVIGWNIIMFVFSKKGRERIRLLFETLWHVIEVLTAKLFKRLTEDKKKKEPEKEEKPQGDTDGDKKPIEMTVEEWKDFNKFMEAMKENRPFVLK